MKHEFEGVLQDVQTKFGVTREELLCPSRGSAAVAEIRQQAMYECWLKERNFTAVGNFFVRDRTTVRHAVRKIENQK
ncbi:chromosomal replication initiator DnaA-like protein [Rhizobium phage RHph_I72]|nr:chromosomal replication initiator DnaA-like protein [Rhizobium phage RHph_I65]QIG76459.1 chromosomal replication initiator DnaA-like protein [Rhizobium phage RHph_I72]